MRAAKYHSIVRPVRGFSLVELLIVVGLLGLIAAVAVPGITREYSETSDAAAQAVAGAIRYAQEQAFLSGDVHGIDIDQDANQLRVFRLVTAGRPLYTVRHPLTKQLYTLTFGVGVLSKVSIKTLTMTATGTCNNTDLVGFDRQGMSRCTDPLSTPVTAGVSLDVGGHTTSIRIDPVVGLVTVQ